MDRLFVGLCLDDFLAAVVATWADVMAKMDFAADRLDCERRFVQKVVRSVHAALRCRLLILLDSHVQLLLNG